MLIFLTGVRGAGKTSCIDRLRRRSDLKILEPSTTRKPREAQDTEYDFRADFDVPMAWSILVNDCRYGMRQSEVDQVNVSEVGLTVFEPANIEALIDFRSKCVHEIVIIGLDTIETILGQEQRVAGAANRVQAQPQIDLERDVMHQHADLILRGSLEENVDAVQSTIRILRSRGGVIDGKTILSFVKAGALLERYQADAVQSASYDLHLGLEILFDGGVISFTPEKSSFSIPPYSFIIAEAEEIADLPKFVSARFDLRVSHFMRGIILSNGPQVDPGFRGALFCMLYNASDKPVPIKRGDHFATIEFHTTALNTTAVRKTEYHAFENIQRLSAEILERPGSKLLSRIEGVVRDARMAWGFWTVVVSLWVAALLVPIGWALSVLNDTQKMNAELKNRLAEADDALKKLAAAKEALQAPRRQGGK